MQHGAISEWGEMYFDVQVSVLVVLPRNLPLPCHGSEVAAGHACTNPQQETLNFFFLSR